VGLVPQQPFKAPPCDIQVRNFAVGVECVVDVWVVDLSGETGMGLGDPEEIDRWMDGWRVEERESVCVCVCVREREIRVLPPVHTTATTDSSPHRPFHHPCRMCRGLHPPEVVAQCLSEAEHLLNPPAGTLPFGIARPQRLDWCDGWQLGLDRLSLKANESDYAKELRAWLSRWGTLPSKQKHSAGVLTRQEVASMVPAALLGDDAKTENLNIEFQVLSKEHQAPHYKFMGLKPQTTNPQTTKPKH
jgi:hypothetical protein